MNGLRPGVALFVAALACCNERGEGLTGSGCRDLSEESFTISFADGPLFAFEIELPEASELTSFYIGTATTADPEIECIVAFYVFAGEPNPDLLPEVHAGVQPPATLPDGGTLAFVRNLPAGGYVAPIQQDLVPATSVSSPQWLVGVTCTETQVQLDLSFRVQTCGPGEFPLWLPGIAERRW